MKTEYGTFIGATMMTPPSEYELFEAIGSGGMGTVHLARKLGPAGFSRVLAIKQLKEAVHGDPQHAVMLLDEARLTGRIRSSFVVPTIDVVVSRDNIMVVMEYVLGEPLGRVIRQASLKQERIPADVAAAIVVNALSGLQAAHELAEDGVLLGLVHRDISPENILVGADGVARVLDFGIAKALGRSQTTGEGQVKGKVAYMSPEQMRGEAVDARSDLFSAAIVLWEALVGRRLFGGGDMRETVGKLLNGPLVNPCDLVPEIPKQLGEAVLKGLAREKENRFQTAKEMIVALEAAIVLAPTSRISGWLEQLVGEEITQRRERILELEQTKVITRMAAVGLSEQGDQTGQAKTDTSRLDVEVDLKQTRKTPVLIAAIAAFVTFAIAVGAIAAVFVYFASDRKPGTTNPPVPSSSSDVALSAPLPVASVEASVVATVTPLMASTISSNVPAVSTKKVGVASVRPTSKPPAIDCKDPYRIKESGEREYRRECLR
jgi:eukaryotic-like serine/threonine-protein kinase